MRLRRSISLLALALLPLAAGCGKVRAIVEIVSGLYDIYPGANVNVSAEDGGVVALRVENAPQKTEAERAAAARKAAEYLRDHFPEWEYVNAVKVVYADGAASNALVDVTTFVITREELASSDSTALPAASGARTAIDLPPPANLDSIDARMDSLGAHADSVMKDAQRRIAEAISRLPRN